MTLSNRRLQPPHRGALYKRENALVISRTKHHAWVLPFHYMYQLKLEQNRTLLQCVFIYLIVLIYESDQLLKESYVWVLHIAKFDIRNLQQSICKFWTMLNITQITRYNSLCIDRDLAATSKCKAGMMFFLHVDN